VILIGLSSGSGSSMDGASASENSLYAWDGCAGLLTIEYPPDRRATANVGSGFANGVRLSDVSRSRKPGLPMRQAQPIRFSEQVGLDMDVAMRRLGVRADPVRRVDQRLRNLAVDTRQADVEAYLEDIGAAVEDQVDFCINYRQGREGNLPLGGRVRL